MAKVKKDQAQDKVGQVMSEWKDGKLKTPEGKVVTDKNQALAIALSEAGLTKKNLDKIETINRIRVQKSEIKKMIESEIKKQMKCKAGLNNIFSNNTKVTKEDIEEYSKMNEMSPDDVNSIIYDMLLNKINDGEKNDTEKL